MHTGRYCKDGLFRQVNKMTREEAIQVLRHIIQVADTSDCGIKEIDGIDEEALDMAIKALQDKGHDRKKAKRFKNKYLKLKTAIEKIKAEIIEERKGYPPIADEYKAINKVLQIIDKYKAESEDKEGL